MTGGSMAATGAKPKTITVEYETRYEGDPPVAKVYKIEKTHTWDWFNPALSVISNVVETFIDIDGQIAANNARITQLQFEITQLQNQNEELEQLRP
jgi:hypothetical protein